MTANDESSRAVRPRCVDYNSYVSRPQGLQRRRGGVCALSPLGCLVGVAGRSNAESSSARRMNCIGVSGEPFVEGDEPIDLVL